MANPHPRRHKRFFFTGKYKRAFKTNGSFPYCTWFQTLLALPTNYVLARLKEKPGSLAGLANEMKQSNELQGHAELGTASQAMFVLLLRHLRKNKILEGEVGAPKIKRETFTIILRRHADSKGKETLVSLCKQEGIGKATYSAPIKFCDSNAWSFVEKCFVKQSHYFLGLP